MGDSERAVPDGGRRRRSPLLLIGSLMVVLCLASCSSASTPTSTQSLKVRAYVVTALNFMGKYGLYVKPGPWAKTREDTLVKTASDTTYKQAYGNLMLAAWAAGGSRHSGFRSASDLANLFTGYGNGTTRPSGSVINPGIASIVLPQFLGGSQADRQGYADTGVNLIRTLAPAATCGWVVDLRANGGGNMIPMLGAASPLLRHGQLISFVDRHKTTTWTTLNGSTITYNGETRNPDESITAAGNAPALTGKHIAVLQSKNTGSSGEATLLAFHGQPGVRTFGQQSAGLTTDNIGMRMPDGANLLVTTGRMTDHTGKTYPNGIPPQQTTNAATIKSATDPTLAAATTWLHAQCGT